MGWLPLALAGVSAASGAAELLWGGKETEDDKKWREWLENRMKNGDPQALAVLAGALSPGILKGQYAKQNNVARMHAARGTSYSTQADADIVSVPGPGDILPPIMAEADMKIRAGAEDNFFKLRESIRQRRTASQKAGWNMIGQGLWMGAQGYMGEGGGYGDEEFPMSADQGAQYGAQGLNQPYNYEDEYEKYFPY